MGAGGDEPNKLHESRAPVSSKVPTAAAAPDKFALKSLAYGAKQGQETERQEAVRGGTGDSCRLREGGRRDGLSRMRNTTRGHWSGS